MQGIYNYIQQIYVSKLYSVVALLQFQFTVRVILFSMIRILYFYITACRSMFALTSMPISLVP